MKSEEVRPIEQLRIAVAIVTDGNDRVRRRILASKGIAQSEKATSLSRCRLLYPIFRSSGSGQTTTFVVPESLGNHQLTLALPALFHYYNRCKSFLTSIPSVARS
jgi:hypothetical protein